MLFYITMLFIVALLAAVIGLGGLGAGMAELAAMLFFLFAALVVLSLAADFVRRRLLRARVVARRPGESGAGALAAKRSRL